MNYRLALKLALETKPSGEVGSHGALGWAVLRLADKPAQFSGQGALPVDLLDGPVEVRAILYENPQEMHDPMPLAAQQERLSQIMKTLPDGCTLVRVLFDGAAYTKWRGERPDTSAMRSEWANSLEL
ncbi:MAG: hypothetical protein LBV49_04255 [Azonexus sp.]|jgi:hypothetical protein|nr:hypothetical protein [Azonexus sp.]